ncbi:MAG: helix-turn-helix domain-containing protein [Quadrisphaera sp.]
MNDLLRDMLDNLRGQRVDGDGRRPGRRHRQAAGPARREAAHLPRAVTLTTRTLAVLGAFTAREPRLRLADVAVAAGLPLTTTHRIVGDLVAWGALERAPDGTLSVGLRLWELASLAPRGPELREVALPFLEDLYTATRGRTSSWRSARTWRACSSSGSPARTPWA